MVNTRKRMFAFLCAVILALAASPVYGLQTGADPQSASTGDLEASTVTVTKTVAGSVDDGYTVNVEITAADPAEDAEAENSGQTDSTKESVTLNLQADLLNQDTVLKEVIAKEFDAENAEISAEAFVPGEDGLTVDKEKAPTAEKNGQTFSVSGFDYSSLLPVAEETAAPVQKLLVTISGLQYSGEPADGDQKVAVDTEVSGFYKNADAEEAAQALPVSELAIPASLQENGSVLEAEETETVATEESSTDEETDAAVSKDADLLKDGNLAKSLVVDQLMSAADPALTSTLLGASDSSANTVEVGKTITINGTSGTYHWWDSSEKSVATVSENENLGTVTGVKEGSVTITHTFGSKSNKTHKDNQTERFSVTVTASSTTPETPVSDEEATAHSGSLSSDNLTVSVKETGNLKKISDYDVVVKDAASDYSSTVDLLKAYHIYLAYKETENEVPESVLQENVNGELNLKITLTYDSSQEWFDQIQSVKHYKGTDEPWISTYSISGDKKSISFNVHGFSDFVFVKGSDPNSGTGTVTGDGDDFLLSKTATPTGVENEYEISLKVWPKITWGKKQTIVEKKFEEIMATTGIAIKNNANETESTDVEHYDESVENMWEAAKELGGANTGLIMNTESLARQYFSKDSGGKLYEINTIVIGDTTINLENTHYLYQTSFSNNTSIWVFPNRNYVKLTVKYEGTKVTSDHWINGTITFASENAKSLIIKAASEFITEDDVDNWSNALIAKPDSVSDPMGQYISFLEFSGIDGGNTASGNSASSSWSSASEKDGTPDSITWNFSNSLPKGSSANDYEVISEKYYLKSSCYELKYKIRLDVQNQGFNSTNPITVENDNGETSWYKTNGTTTLTKADGGMQVFEVPEVCGILYDLKFQKVDESGNPIKKQGNITNGAIFKVTGSGNSVAENITRQAESDENGYVTFEGLPWGTYTIQEISAPTGYEKSSESKLVTLCYTTNSDSLKTSTVNETHLMNDDENSLTFVNTKIIEVTGLTLDSPQGALGAGSAVVLLSIGFWFLRRRILHP